jgi:hypothetical protein
MNHKMLELLVLKYYHHDASQNLSCASANQEKLNHWLFLHSEGPMKSAREGLNCSLYKSIRKTRDMRMTKEEKAKTIGLLH